MKKEGGYNYFKGIMTLIGLLLFILILFAVPKTNRFSRIIAYLFIALALVLILQLIRARLSYISKEGIRIGNCYRNCSKHLILKQKPTFILWDKVKNIKIFGVKERSLIHGFTSDYLSVATKDHKKYDCLLNDPKGFLKTIEDLKKSHLFTKDSKY